MTLSAPVRTASGRRLARRWDPVHEMEDVYERMGRLMQDFLGDGTTFAAAMGMPEWAAPADIEETDDEFIVEIDLPGVRREDIHLQLSDNDLMITGEIKDRERAGVVRRKARQVGHFEHIVALPGEVDGDRVDATFTNGVLTVHLAKATMSRLRKIEVKEPRVTSGQGAG